MTIKEKYGQCTADGCSAKLSELNGLNDDITIGELRTFLLERKEKANNHFKKEQENTAKKLTGKCFRYFYSIEHIVLLKIDKAEMKLEHGFPITNLDGESITNYKGQISHKVLSGSDKNFENYHPTNQTEISLKEFNRIKSTLRSINF